MKLKEVIKMRNWRRSLIGISAPESGNNGVTGGALVPLLTLGVPGDAILAVLLGALIIQGLTQAHYF